MKIRSAILLVSLLIALIAAVWALTIVASSTNTAQTPVVSTPWSPTATASTDSALAAKYACTFTHHGQTFTVPYTETHDYGMFALSQITPTKFDYIWRSIPWELEATCHGDPGPSFGRSLSIYTIMSDIPVPPLAGTGINAFTCQNTYVRIYDSKGIYLWHKCDFLFPAADDIRIQVKYGSGPDEDDYLLLKWRWEQNTNTDSNASPWLLQYQFSGQNGSFAQSLLECKWIDWPDYNGTPSMSLEGRETGYFGFGKKQLTSVICAGDGYTVTLEAWPDKITQQ